MNINIQEYPNERIVVSLAGRVDAFSVPELQEQLNTYLETGFKHFIMDLTMVPFIDSAGMAILIKLLKRVSQVEGSIVLVMPQEEAVQRTLRLTHFDHLFHLADTVKDAIER